MELKDIFIFFSSKGNIKKIFLYVLSIQYREKFFEKKIAVS